jgi:exosome complex exonuclease RRP6
MSLPSDLAFHRSMDSSFAHDLDAFSARVLKMANELLVLAGTIDAAKSSSDEGRDTALRGEDDVIDRFHSTVVDSMDRLLERAVRATSTYIYSN